MNKVFLIGNLTKDPEITTIANGISVAKFTIGVARKFGENESDFINIVAWRNLAEVCKKYLAKGNKVAVCGAIQVRSYDAQDGTKRYVTEVVADDVEFLTPKQEPKFTPIDDGELPF